MCFPLSRKRDNFFPILVFVNKDSFIEVSRFWLVYQYAEVPVFIGWWRVTCNPCCQKPYTVSWSPTWSGLTSAHPRPRGTGDHTPRCTPQWPSPRMHAWHHHMSRRVSRSRAPLTSNKPSCQHHPCLSGTPQGCHIGSHQLKKKCVTYLNLLWAEKKEKVK